MTPRLPSLALVGAALLAAGCGDAAKARNTGPAEQARTVRVVKATERALPRTLVAVGTLAAQERADLSFKVPGRVKRWIVDIGSVAAEGAVLVELEANDYELRLARARAALAQARARLGLSAEGTVDDVAPEDTGVVRQSKAKLDEARAQLERSKSLLSEGVLSKASFDVVESTFKVAESQYNDSLEEVNNRRGILAEKRSDVALAEQQLRDARLVAPFSGAVQMRKVSLGEYVAAGTPALTLVKMNPIRLRVEVPEREARTVKKGQAVTVKAEGDPTVWKGTVARISPALEEANRSLIVEAEIANPKGLLRPGAFARAEIETDSGAKVVVVPARAVVVFAGIEKVVTVKERKAVEKPVVTGRRSGDFVEIVSGVAAGDTVVDNPGNLATGMAVTPEGKP